MRFAALVRTSSALWAAPPALGLVLFYFHVSFSRDYEFTRGDIPYALETVSFVLDPLYALAYATASSLAAWESGRMNRAGVWASAPARSRHAIAAHTLLPVLVLAWAMLLFPVGLGLLSEGTALTPDCAPLLIMALFVAAAHGVIGFAVGLVVPRLVAPPLLAAGVFYGVASSASSGERMWPRHVSGAFSTVLSFGERTTWTALAPQFLFTGSIALGLALLGVTARNRGVRTAVPVLSCVVALTGTLAAYDIAEGWGHTAPLSVGHARMTCAGSAPRVCVPVAGGAEPAEVRAEAEAVVRELAAAGVRVTLPRTMSDSVVNGAHPRPSTGDIWWLPLTAGQRDATTRYQVLTRAVRFPCASTSDEVASRSAMLWAAGNTGEAKRYLTAQREELAQYDNGDEVFALIKERVATVRRASTAAQASWYRSELKRACGDAGRAGDT
ncbi:hypothetical protein [Streptomyces alboflavus]|uniref:hypothetical protein n=1 Tax=Streptomyces alboflavus TaxID=67267 RepID=UPI00068F37F6|nr:hypothetical protein [Streptomyces alboflavus]